MTRRLLLAWSLGLAGALAGCEGNHSALAKDPNAGGNPPAGGSGGEGGAGGAGFGGFGEGGRPVEPEGPTKLTIVGGVVDYDAIALCFVPYPRGGATTPWPSGGLAFAGARVVDPIDSVIAPGVDIDLWVIGGDLGAVFGETCEDIITDPTIVPDAIVVELGIIPASVFEEPRSLLLVPHGCMGGPTHEHEMQASVCGGLYAPDTPSMGLLAGGMSRLPTAGKVGLQVAHAVSAMEVPVEIRIVRGVPGALPSVLSPDVTVGGILPFPPFASFSPSDLGTIGLVRLLTVPMGVGNPTSEVTFSEALANGGLTGDDIGSSQNYVAVAVGAGPGVPAGPWWNTFTYALVQSDPDP